MKTLPFASPEFANLPCVVTIGAFDGIHLGHRRIIETCVRTAKSRGACSVVVTFSTNPKMATGSIKSCRPICSAAQLDELLINADVDYHCIIDFSSNMSKISGEEFIALLCTSYRLEAMVVGSSFRCGNSASSVGPSEIRELLSIHTSAAFLGVPDDVTVNGDVVSSSMIRRCLLTGDMDKASMLLGRAYSLDLRGIPFEEESEDPSQNRLLYEIRTLANIVPKEGVYKVEATGCGKVVKAKAAVSENVLALDLPVRIVPDTISFLGE